MDERQLKLENEMKENSATMIKGKKGAQKLNSVSPTSFPYSLVTAAVGT